MTIPGKPTPRRHAPRLLHALAILALVSFVWVLLGSSVTASVTVLLERHVSTRESSWSYDTEEGSFSIQEGGYEYDESGFESEEEKQAEEETIQNAITKNPVFCIWDVSLDDCYRRLKPRLATTRHWIAMGDSTMAKLAARVRKEPSFRWAGKRCFDLDYYRLPKASVWVPPNASLGEGPAKYGLRAPFCHDMGASSYHNAGPLEGTSFEYLGVEFARDVSLPTDQTATTQETVARYLRENPYNDPRTPETTACLVGTGLHDCLALKTVKNAERRLAIYLTNVKDYLGLLKPFCGTIVWLGINAVQERAPYVQNNNEMKEWNYGVYDMLARERSLDMVVAMDVFPKTSRSEHLDNVHMSDEYYQELAGFLFTNVTSFLQLDEIPRPTNNTQKTANHETQTLVDGNVSVVRR